jgi:hypothetical protein
VFGHCQQEYRSICGVHLFVDLGNGPFVLKSPMMRSPAQNILGVHFFAEINGQAFVTFDAYLSSFLKPA